MQKCWQTPAHQASLSGKLKSGARSTEAGCAHGWGTSRGRRLLGARRFFKKICATGSDPACPPPWGACEGWRRPAPSGRGRARHGQRQGWIRECTSQPEKAEATGGTPGTCGGPLQREATLGLSSPKLCASRTSFQDNQDALTSSRSTSLAEPLCLVRSTSSPRAQLGASDIHGQLACS